MKTCLIVDDSRVVRKVMARIAKDLGLACTEAEDGAKAYDHCQKQMPDLVFLDWNMPVMSGIEFLEKLRQLEKGDQPDVILCTTENDMPHLNRALKAGASEYIMKPFDREVVEAKLKQIGALD